MWGLNRLRGIGYIAEVTGRLQCEDVAPLKP